MVVRGGYRTSGAMSASEEETNPSAVTSSSRRAAATRCFGVASWRVVAHTKADIVLIAVTCWVWTATQGYAAAESRVARWDLRETEHNG